MSEDIIILYNDGKTDQEIIEDFKRRRAAKKAAKEARWEKREARVKAWAKKVDCTTAKIRTNSEYWYERLGIKRKSKK